MQDPPRATAALDVLERKAAEELIVQYDKAWATVEALARAAEDQMHRTNHRTVRCLRCSRATSAMREALARPDVVAILREERS